MDYKAYALLGILLASFVSVSATSAAFAQSAMTVKTDKTSYQTGDTITVSGSVGTVSSGTTAVIKVLNPKGVVYRIDPITVGADGSFTYTLKVGGPIGVTGQYTVQITYNNQQQTSNFDFTSNTITPSGQWQTTTVTIAGKSYPIRYQITGGSFGSASANPDTQTLNFTLNNVGNGGSLKLELPRNVIDSKTTSGGDDQFAVFVDDIDTAYDENGSDSSVRVLQIPLDAGSTTVEVVGTYMVPEFGAIAAIVLAVAIVGIIVATTRYSSKLSFLPKF